jgi:serine/threonine protein kinase/predicted Zn-dependent protease
MRLSSAGSTWDEALSPQITSLQERFEADWRLSGGSRPDPRKYLPSDPAQHRDCLLTLLRADLTLRWKAKEPVSVEQYRERFPELDGDALVELLYEEYCLREEAGESPQASEYDSRFPDIAASFREVLEIHGVIGKVRGPLAMGPNLTEAPFPEVGQTIAGFSLTEELGRGAFARVYRALERQLADRPVALKVTRTGSREPQMLARLQHTHIVPVHSYRTDPATDLHLLCMPYLGRITLSHVLNDASIRSARTGADLHALLGRLQVAEGPTLERPVKRLPFALRTYSQVIAWWGARLAEALQHAHDRGVLHRDIKPSNVLISGDGVPMLLDFNLAREPWLENPEAAPAALGGTLAYMAPEHLDALAEGLDEHVDIRSDIFALGVVLFDCLVRGTRSFALPSGSETVVGALRRMAKARREPVPRLRTSHPEVPAALEAVVRCCLAPDPGDRYASAADLAADLQAVADDGPLRFAREPLPSRSIRWLRRNKGVLSAAFLLLLTLSVSLFLLFSAKLELLRNESDAKHWINEGDHSVKEGQLDLAISQYETAARITAGEARLASLGNRAREARRLAVQRKDARTGAEGLFNDGERIRFSLLGFGGDPDAAHRWVSSALGKFSLPGDPQWMLQPQVTLLDEQRHHRLLDEVNELLFLWVVSLDRARRESSAMAREAVQLCNVAMAFAVPIGPWQTIRERYSSILAGRAPDRRALDRTGGETSARGCFQWALLCDLEGRPEATISWLERATRLDPGDYWSQFYLGYYHRRAGHNQQAMEHYQAAVALRPHSPWAWYNQALLHQARGELEQAMIDLNRSLTEAQRSSRTGDFLEARLALGVVKQSLGDVVGARLEYESVMDRAAGGPLGRAARLNRAKLDVDGGAIDRAVREYDSILGEDPKLSEARFGRALLALHRGDANRAEADLTILLRDEPGHADEIFAWRALAWLALGVPKEAESDAANAYRRKATPSRERLWIRTLFALGRVEELSWITQPDDLIALPGSGPSLRADLRTALLHLQLPTSGARVPAALACRTCAVILSALDDPGAEREATRAIELSPHSVEAYLVRARVRRRAGNTRGALADVEAGLSVGPGDSRLLELRGLLKAESGNPRSALLELNRAVGRGGRGSVRAARAMTLFALGDDRAAVEDWTLALAEDAEDPLNYLGRAQALIRLRQWHRALVDLEQAAGWAFDNPRILTRTTLYYAACLPENPRHLSRWLALARRTCRAWIATLASHPLDQAKKEGDRVRP